MRFSNPARAVLVYGGMGVLAVITSACGGSSDADSTTTSTEARTTTTTTEAAVDSTTTSSNPVVEPEEVLEGFYRSWADGRIDDAMSLTAPGFASSVGSSTETTGYLEFVTNLGVQASVDECSTTPIGSGVSISCDFVMNHPVGNALELEPPRAKHTIQDGFLTEINWRPIYTLADATLNSYAAGADPDGHRAACAENTDLVLSGLTVNYTSSCGSFLAGHAGDAAMEIIAAAAAGDELDPVQVVADFYDAWGAGDLTAAASYLSPTLTSPAGAEVGPGLPRFLTYMRFIDTVPQNVSAADCELTGSDLVTCTVSYRDPVIDALGIEGGNTLHRVKHGLLVHVTLPAPYAESDRAVDSYLKANAAEEYAEECAIPEGGLTWGEFGLAFNARCAEFIGGYLEEIAASL